MRRPDELVHPRLGEKRHVASNVRSFACAFSQSQNFSDLTLQNCLELMKLRIRDVGDRVRSRRCCRGGHGTTVDGL